MPLLDSLFSRPQIPGVAPLPQKQDSLQRVPQPNVDAVPQDQLVLSAPARDLRLPGKKTLDIQLPIVKGSYRLVMDYVSDKENHLYVVDKRNDKIVARYLSNGGKKNLTAGTNWTIDRKITRPTWTPTPNEMKMDNYGADGPGPTSSMGLAKLHFVGNEYIHGVYDASVDGKTVDVEADNLNDLGTPHSYGCWNMSNPNVIELVERFGIDQGSQIKILRHNSAADRQESQHLAAEMKSQGLGDRPLSAGLDLLEADYAGPHKYLNDKPYRTLDGEAQPEDGWYVKLWERRQAAGM